MVRITARRDKLPKDVQVLNPFGHGEGVTFPADPAATKTLAFAIIHGTKAGWNTAQAAGKFLLFGGSPILILQYERTFGPEDGKDLMSLIRKRGQRRRGERSPPARRKAIRFPSRPKLPTASFTGTERLIAG